MSKTLLIFILSILVFFIGVALSAETGTPSAYIKSIIPKNDTLHWDPATKILLVQKAQDFIIECRIDRGTAASVVEWIYMKGSDTHQISYRMTSRDTAKYKIAQGEASHTYRLTVFGPDENDEGKYICSCQYALFAEAAKSFINIVVVSKPQILSADSSTSQTAKRGDNVQLTCKANGNPTPLVGWERAGKGKLPGGGFFNHGETFDIYNIQPEDQGIYVCEAKNRMGISLMKVQVSVQFEPICRVANNGVFYQKQGYVKDLLCTVEGNPKPDYDKIYWTFGGNKIPQDNSKYLVTISSGGSYIYYTSLTLKSVSDDDYSTDTKKYKCHAANSQGAGAGSVELMKSMEATPDRSGRIRAGASAISTSVFTLITTLFLAEIVLAVFNRRV